MVCIFGPGDALIGWRRHGALAFGKSRRSTLRWVASRSTWTLSIHAMRPPRPTRRRAVLEQAGTVDVVAECGEGESALAAYLALRPDVLLLDLRMPRLDGLERTPSPASGGGSAFGSPVTCR